MDRKEYCDRVLAQVGRLTSDEANDLRNELAGHIEDHAEALSSTATRRRMPLRALWS